MKANRAPSLRSFFGGVLIRSAHRPGKQLQLLRLQMRRALLGVFAVVLLDPEPRLLEGVVAV